MNEIITINGISCYEKDGVGYLNLEACARGLGFVDNTKGTEYVKWDRVGKYLGEIGFSTEVSKDGFIPESIFYRLAMKAKNETAERFQAVVAEEILPAIRRHGVYATPQAVEAMLNDPDTLIITLQALKTERAKAAALSQQVEEDRPKVAFANSVIASEDGILVGELAKIIKQNGVDMGEKRLFERLRHEGYLVKQKGNAWNDPTQKSMTMGLMRIKKSPRTRGDGCVVFDKTTKITGKGQVYFVNRYCGRH